MLPISMEGYIYKWTNAIFGWQLKYVEIKGDEFHYYKDKDGKLQGVIPLKGFKLEIIANEPLRIILQLSDNTSLYLKCKTMTDKIKWVNAFYKTQQEDNLTVKNEFQVALKRNDIEPLKDSLSLFLQSKLFADSSKLDAYLIQVWTLQGLLEASLSDFSEELVKISSPSERLKENAERIKRYTMELKVL